MWGGEREKERGYKSSSIREILDGMKTKGETVLMRRDDRHVDV